MRRLTCDQRFSFKRSRYSKRRYCQSKRFFNDMTSPFPSQERTPFNMQRRPSMVSERTVRDAVPATVAKFQPKGLYVSNRCEYFLKAFNCLKCSSVFYYFKWQSLRDAEWGSGHLELFICCTHRPFFIIYLFNRFTCHLSGPEVASAKRLT